MPLSPVNDGVAIWSPDRPWISMLIGLPALIVSSTFLGLLVSIFIESPKLALLAAVAAALVALTLRITSWSAFAARRTVASSGTSLTVRRGNSVELELPWEQISSVTLNRGSTLARLLLNVTSDLSDFPYITAAPHDRWAVEPASRGLLAFLPRDYARLSAALAAECERRGVAFEPS